MSAILRTHSLRWPFERSACLLIRSHGASRPPTSSVVRYQRRHFGSDGSSPRKRPDAADGQDRSGTIEMRSLYKFITGTAFFAKRPPRPFPPPFLSPPSGSFSDPLSTHHRSRHRGPSVSSFFTAPLEAMFGSSSASEPSRVESPVDADLGEDERQPKVNGELIRGWTNGDDAAYVSETFLAVGDGVGAWSARERGHAGLWARLMVHFWSKEVQDAAAAAYDNAGRGEDVIVPVEAMQKAYEQTVKVTTKAGRNGTTTAIGALLSSITQHHSNKAIPVLHTTNLGDSQILIIRPSSRELIFKSAEQWHWFDCPYQVGTDSFDTPLINATSLSLYLSPGDVVLVVSDGVSDNLWPEEILTTVCDIVSGTHSDVKGLDREVNGESMMKDVARELMLAAKRVAVDVNASPPFMEKLFEQGVLHEGGKMDDITVLAGLVVKC